MRWTTGRFFVSSDPYLRVGLANTERGNRTALVVPLSVGLQPTRRWLLAAHSGYNSDLAVWADGFHMPFTLSTRVAVTEIVDVSVEAGFYSAIGPQNSGSTRSMIVAVSVRPGGWRAAD